jgi:cobalt transporter subunit CbtB
MMSQSSAIGRPGTADRTFQLVYGLAAMAFGLLIIGVVGFAHIDAVHNAAHDVRHSNAFPCH